MSITKFSAFLLLALLSISMLQTLVLANHGHGGHHKNRNAHRNARGGAARRSTTSPACSSSVRSAATSACVCHRGFYGNKGVCPCYNNWKTKEGGPKCP
ncbi:GAST1 protein homolog 4 [Actinidia rufa]|uniref:GAST1 protein homolog 4 n=1 Tax=Actinidia rufa TaxID=165716 RepID=A0A7J0EN66_9ERIC|nr:GAST1 protein homolog 4 [Actinidia rufa]